MVSALLLPEATGSQRCGSSLAKRMGKSADKEGESALLSDGESTGKVFSSRAGPTTSYGDPKHAWREGGEKLELL